MPGGEREPADGGDRWQRFAAETQRGHALQVVKGGDLAGRVPGNGQAQVVRGDAFTVIADADQSRPAFLQVDVDAPRAGVQGILDQFLDHRRRPFHHLAGSDLVDEGVGKLADRHGDGRLDGALDASVAP
jgi:hypothetical protein